MPDLNKMTSEQFRFEIAKLEHFDVASVATQMVNSRGNNTRKWDIKVYPSYTVGNFNKAVIENESKFKFWSYVNDDKSIIHTTVYMGDEELEIGLSSTIDRFGSIWWFEEIESAMKKRNWI